MLTSVPEHAGDTVVFRTSKGKRTSAGETKRKSLTVYTKTGSYDVKADCAEIGSCQLAGNGEKTRGKHLRV